MTGVSGPKPQQTGQIKNWEGQVAYREKKNKKKNKKKNIDGAHHSRFLRVRRLERETKTARAFHRRLHWGKI